MSEASRTPETNAKVTRLGAGHHTVGEFVPADFARSLETQRDAALERERGLREVVTAMHKLLDRDITYNGTMPNYPAAMLPFENHDQAMNHIAEARRLIASALAAKGEK